MPITNTTTNQKHESVCLPSCVNYQHNDQSETLPIKFHRVNHQHNNQSETRNRLSSIVSATNTATNQKLYIMSVTNTATNQKLYIMSITNTTTNLKPAPVTLCHRNHQHVHCFCFIGYTTWCYQPNAYHRQQQP